MAYPVSAAPASPMAAPPQPAFDMSRFDADLAELQQMLVDLDGDGVPDTPQGAPATGRPADVPPDAIFQQEYQDMFNGQTPAPRPPAGPRAPLGGAPVDVQALAGEARERIARGEPRESVIQDLYLRVARGRAAEAGQPVRMAQATGPAMSDAENPMLRQPMPPRGPARGPRFSGLPMPPDAGNDGSVMTRPPGSLGLPDANHGEDDADRAQREFIALRARANEEMTRQPEPPPERPWRGWSSLGEMAMDAVPEMPSREDLIEGVDTSLQGLEALGFATQATGGPPGVIIGGAGRLLSRAGRAALGDRTAEAARNLSSPGRRWNRATDSMRESARVADEITRRGGDARDLSAAAGRLIGQRPNPNHGFLHPDSIGHALKARALRERVGDAATEFLTREPMQYPALPSPPPGGTGGGAGRLVAPEAQPIPPPRAYEMAGGGRLLQRETERARDMVRGTANSAPQRALDDSIDGFMQTLSQVPREHTASIPRLIKQQADEVGVSLSDVVSALERRGYRIDADSVPMHAFQARTPDGRWSKLDPEWAELLSIIRERAGRPTVRGSGR
jgi:hypothetical protein